MTESEAGLLRELRGLPNGAAPIALGGSSGSHHSVTLRRMVPKGWVEQAFRGLGWGEAKRWASRGSCLYRITPKGEQALANHLALRGQKL